MIDRHFVRLKEGLVHYRQAGTDQAAPPILMMHPSPASSALLEPLMESLCASRRVIAPDTLGNGESAPPKDNPDMVYYADSMLRFLDALGVDRFDVYGSHTGSHIGIELALLCPERVRHLAMHGIALLSESEREEFLAHYAPEQAPDVYGSQFNWAWHYIRDQMIFYPHFRKTASNLRTDAQLDPEFLHNLTLGLLKNLSHYHKTYHAVFRHQVLERLARVSTPACLLTHDHDPLASAVEGVTAHCTNVEIVTLADASPATESAGLLAWLSETQSSTAPGS